MSDLPETNEILKTGLGSGKPYLGSPQVVSDILRSYLDGLTKLRTEQVDKGSDPIPMINNLASAIQDIFYGQDPDYQSFAWNSESSLGRALVDQCGIGGETGDAAYRVAVRMAKEYLLDLIAYEKGSIGDEHMQSSVDAILEKYTRIFNGSASWVPHNE